MAHCADAVVTTPHHRGAGRIWLGREREVHALEAGLDELADGRGGLFLLVGEPGIGKTRLADELARSATARGFAVHWGRAWEAGGAPSYWLVVQVLRSMARGATPDTLDELLGARADELGALLPELRRRIPASARAPIHATRERFALFEAVQLFLRAVATTAPQVVVLDDLHAADPSSLSLLHFIVRGLRSTPVLVIGTYREADARIAPAIGSTLAQIAREAVVLPLRPLDRSEVAEFVVQTTGVAASEDIDTLFQRSEGNPLFLRELLRLPGLGPRPPDGIRDVLHARLSLLSPEVRCVLEAAAVLGREIELDLLAPMLDAPEHEVSESMIPAIDAAIVEPFAAPATWRFTHVLLREALYADLGVDRRAVLHRAAAAVLRRHHGESRLAERAHHLFHAIPAVTVADATDAALEAADHAMRVLAFEDACVVLTRIGKRLENAVGENRRCFEVMLALGVARIRAGDMKLGKESCLRAAALARRIGDGELLARAVLGSACEFVAVVRDVALIALLEEALAALPPGDGALRARCMAQLAAERQPEPDTRGPIELARAAVAMARRVGDAETLRFTLSHAGLAMLVFAAPAERIAVQQECLRLSLAVGDKLTAARDHLLLMAAHMEAGDLAGGDAHARAYEALLELRHPRYRWTPPALRAMRALWEGNFADAERWANESAVLWRQDEGRGAEWIAFPLGFCRATERYEDLPAIESQLRAAFGQLQHELGSCLGEMFIAQLHARVGDLRRTTAQLAVVRAHGVFDEITEACWLSLLAEPCRLLDDRALAQRLYTALLPREHTFFHLGPMGGYSEPTFGRQLGLLAQTLGQLDAAVAHLTESESAASRTGMRSHLARLRYELAGALLERAGPGDRERAMVLLEQARALALELGQAALLPLVSARAGAGTQAGETTTPPSGAGAPSFALRREGEYWAVVSGARTLRLRDSRGLQVLEQLVQHPHREFHVLQLVYAGDDGRDRGDAGPLLDDAAIQSYRVRLLALREDLDEAESFADTARSERAREEIAFLTRELARAVGLGGRERRSSGAAERARTTVQKRLRNVIARITEGLPELGKHLDRAIRTGTFCSYAP